MKNIFRIIASGIVICALAASAVGCVDDEDDGGSIKVTAVAIDGTLILSPGQSERLTVTIVPEDADNKKVFWSSGNSRVSVDENGTVTGLAEGIAIITVTTADGGYTAECEVTVVPAEVTGVELDRDELSIVIENSESLTATVYPENASIKGVTWKSSNETVAVVDADGNVTAKDIGKAVITVRTLEGGKSAECHVTVIDQYDVYAAGYETDGSMYLATVWKNGEMLYQLTDGTWFGFADDVFVTDNGDVYVSGYEAQVQGVNVAYIWKNGELLYTLTDGTRIGHAPRLLVEGNDVYAAGYHAKEYSTSIGYVWKNGEVLYQLGDDTGQMVCNDIFIDNGDIYVAGYEIPKGSNYDRKPRYWKNGEEILLTYGGEYSEANGIMVDNGDIYVTGWDINPNNGYYDNAVVWKNGQINYLSFPNNPASTIAYRSVMKDGVLYTVGWGVYSEGIRGTVWQNYSDPSPWSANVAMFHDIMIAGDDIYTGGQEWDYREMYIAGIWKNGTKIYSMVSTSYTTTYVHGIHVKQ